MKKWLVLLNYTSEEGLRYREKAQITEAENEKSAEVEYNKKNNCTYYYGSCVGEVVGSNVIIPIKGLNSLLGIT